MFGFKRKESLLYNHQINKHGSFFEKLSLYQNNQKHSEAKEAIHNIVSVFQGLDYGNEQDSTKKRRRKR